MNDLDLFIVDFSSELFHFHVSKKKLKTWTELCNYRDSLGEGWMIVNPTALSDECRKILGNRLEPLRPLNFWMPGMTNHPGENYGLFFKRI